MLVCDRCGGSQRILGVATEPHAGRRALVALGLAAEPPPRDPRPRGLIHSRLTPAGGSSVTDPEGRVAGPRVLLRRPLPPGPAWR
jgi:hypothetical protein